jgi:SAM-dependent methyltransferase
MSSKDHMQTPFPSRESSPGTIDEQDRERWNQLYSERSHTSLTPDESLVGIYERFVGPAFVGGGPAPRSPRRALDLAGGVGRNALFLAREGWQVTLNELSDEAARLAEENARRSGLPLTICRASALEALTAACRPNASEPGTPQPNTSEPNTRYDLILMLFYLDRTLFSFLPQALAPGGMLFIKTRTEDHPRFQSGSKHPEYFLRPGELAASFPGLHVLHSREDDGMAELLALRKLPAVREEVPA